MEGSVCQYNLDGLLCPVTVVVSLMEPDFK